MNSSLLSKVCIFGRTESVTMPLPTPYTLTLYHYRYAYLLRQDHDRVTNGMFRFSLSFACTTIRSDSIRSDPIRFGSAKTHHETIKRAAAVRMYVSILFRFFLLLALPVVARRVLVGALVGDWNLLASCEPPRHHHSPRGGSRRFNNILHSRRLVPNLSPLHSLSSKKKTQTSQTAGSA